MPFTNSLHQQTSPLPHHITGRYLSNRLANRTKTQTCVRDRAPAGQLKAANSPPSFLKTRNAELVSPPLPTAQSDTASRHPTQLPPTFLTSPLRYTLKPYISFPQIIPFIACFNPAMACAHLACYYSPQSSLQQNSIASWSPNKVPDPEARLSHRLLCLATHHCEPASRKYP